MDLPNIPQSTGAGEEWPVAFSGPPIYQHLLAHRQPDGSLAAVGLDLPQPVAASGTPFAPGAMDGILRHHTDRPPESRPEPLIAAIEAALQQSTHSRLREVIDECLRISEVDVVDVILSRVDRLASLDHKRLAELGVWLAMNADSVAPAKLGLVLMGCAGPERYRDVILTLGTHDDLTRGAIYALSHTEDPIENLWTLARRVHGWGRIDCVELLAGAADPEVLEWILREGYRNTVLYEYLTLIAARAGDLHEALRREEIDRDLLTSAGEILSSLASPSGPSAGMESYAEGAQAVESYLELMTERAETIKDLDSIERLNQMLGEWDLPESAGWTSEHRERLLGLCRALRRRPGWSDAVRRALDDGDDEEFSIAARRAKEFDVDAFPALVRRIEQDPANAAYWDDAWELAGRERVEQLVGLARLLPAAVIACGAAEHNGLGPEFQVHLAFYFTLIGLSRHPGVAPDLLEMGLRSPVIRNRLAAVAALESWPVWDVIHEAHVADMKSHDPTESVRAAASRARASR